MTLSKLRSAAVVLLTAASLGAGATAAHARPNDGTGAAKAGKTVNPYDCAFAQVEFDSEVAGSQRAVKQGYTASARVYAQRAVDKRAEAKAHGCAWAQ